MIKIVISITGHRILSPAQMERIEPVVREAIRHIMRSAAEQHGTVSFTALSPIAEGTRVDIVESPIAATMKASLVLR